MCEITNVTPGHNFQTIEKKDVDEWDDLTYRVDTQGDIFTAGTQDGHIGHCWGLKL